MPLAEMEVEEIDHRAAPDPIDGIADGAADYQANGEGEQVLAHPGEPDHETADADRCEGGADHGIEPAVGIEEAKAHAPVPGQRQVEERGYREARLRGVGGEEAEDPEFAELVGDRGNKRHGE